MQQSKQFLPPMLPGEWHHFYNRGNNFQNVFLCADDYLLFFDRWRKYIHPVAETFAYCLLPNHFHAAIRIRETPVLQYPDPVRTPQQIIDRGFANFFVSYSRVIQERHKHHGALFHRPFKRKRIESERYFEWLIAYILLNPAKHGLQEHYTTYAYSSFRATFSDAPTLLQREKLLELFGGRRQLMAYLDKVSASFELDDELEAGKFIR